MPRFLAAACWLFAVLLPISAGALGLGEIDLKSGLNEPFVADIPLQLDDPADLDSVNVYLASVATFGRYGLSRPAYLSDFRFFLSSDDSGNGTVQVRSVRPVSEPFVTLLLEVEWPAGKLLREYTVLLDPPVFDAGAVATPVQPAESPAVAEMPPEPISEPVAVTEPEAEPEPVAATVAPAPVIPVQELEPLPQEPEPEPPVAAETNLSLAGSTYGPVTSGQTLWGLAHELRPNSSVDINQMMLALYRTNPSAFVDNINRLKEGAILRIPDSDEIGEMTRSAAFAEAQRQHDQYQASNVSVAGVQLRLVPPADEVLDSSSGGTAFETSATDVLESEPAASLLGEPEAEADESSALLEIEDSGLEALQNQLGELNASAEAQEAIDTEAMVDIETDGSSELDAGLPPALAEPEEPAEASIIESQEPAVEVSPPPDINVVTSQAPDGESLLDRAIGLAEQYWMWGAGLLVAIVLLIGIRRRFAGGETVKDRESDAEDAEDDFAGGWDEEESGAYVVDEATQATGDQGPEFGADLGAMSGEVGAVDIPLEPEPEIDIPLEPEIDILLDPEPAIDIPFEPEPEEEPDVLLEPEHDDVLEATVRIDPEPEPVAEPEFDIDALLEAEPESEPEPEPDIDALPEPDLEAFDAMPETPAAALEPTREAPAPIAAEMPPVEEVAVDDVEGLLESTLSMPGPINLDQADPVAEAEFHMAYGLYDQAADLLIQALQEDQDNRELRVKLLEVYFVWENKEGFLTEARTLREMIANDSDPDWNKVLIMGKQICADDELFSAVPVGAGVDESMDLPLFSEDAGAAGVDVPIDDAGSSPTMEGGADPGLDVEIASGSAADDADDLDLDLGADFSLDAENEVDLSLSPDSPTMESPTMDRPGPESLDDLGADFDDAPGDGDDQVAGTGALVDDDAETMIATEAVASGLTIGDEDATMLSSDAELSAMEAPFMPQEVDATSDWPVLQEDALSDIGVDDLSAALGAGDETVEDFGAAGATVEQPQPDHGASAVGLDELSETDTMKAPGLDDLPEEPTMTEVGTKLDLARAYIDMGDPDGARSILKEVLEEGDDSQQQEARQLLDELKD